MEHWVITAVIAALAFTVGNFGPTIRLRSSVAVNDSEIANIKTRCLEEQKRFEDERKEFTVKLACFELKLDDVRKQVYALNGKKVGE